MYSEELQLISHLTQTCERPSWKVLLSPDRQKELSQPAKPSRQREPFTGVAFDSPLSWSLSGNVQVRASCQLHLCIIRPEARIKDHTRSRLALNRDWRAHKTQFFKAGVSFSSIPKKFNIPRVTSHSQDLKLSEDTREDTALEERGEIQYSGRLHLSYPFSWWSNCKRKDNFPEY